MFRKSTAAPSKDDLEAAKRKKKPAAKKKVKTAVEKVLEIDFTRKLERHKDVREAFDGIIHLDVTGPGGGKWTADLTQSSEWISKGHSGKPKLTIRAGAKDFIALLKGEKNAQLAVMAGDLSLEPMDLDLAMKLGPLFS